MKGVATIIRKTFFNDAAMKMPLSIITLCMLAAPVGAQKHMTGTDRPRHEIAVGTGYRSLTLVLAEGAFGESFDGLQASHSLPIPVSVHYFYNYNDNWFFGVTAHYEQVNKMEFFYGLMPQMKWNWFRQRYVHMYSRLAIGVLYDYRINTSDVLFPDFQLSPFGIEVGKRHWWGYVDLGAGTQDFVQIGLIYKF